MKLFAPFYSKLKVYFPSLLICSMVFSCEQNLNIGKSIDPKQALVETRFGIKTIDSFAYLEDIKVPQNYLWFAEQDQKADSIQCTDVAQAFDALLSTR